MKKTVTFFICLLICFGAGALGSSVTYPAIQSGWYGTLLKPSWNPPNWIFGPMWSSLYLCMTVALWLVLQKDPFKKLVLPVSIFLFQLALNSLWSFLFFGFKNPGLAFLDITLLWCGILLSMIFFWRIHKGAGLLLFPYWLWVSFAGILNFAIWQLNR